MIQPMTYGYPAEYSNDNFSGYFDWSTNNKGMSVLENIMSTNDMAYGIPNTLTKTLIPKVSVINFTAVGSGQPYRGAVAHPNGKIYFIPCDASPLLEFEPFSKKITTWGSVGSTSTNKLVGGVLAPNGIIYALPSNGFTLAVIPKWDPYSKSFTPISVGGLGTNSIGCVLHPNGKIYGVPAGGDVLVFDPNTGKVSDYGILPVNSNYYNGGCVHPNGNIYFAPYQSGIDQVMELNLNSKKYTLLKNKNTLVATNSLFSGIILAPNNLMYCVPHNADRIFEVNPYTKTTRIVGSYLTTTSAKYSGGCVGPDGCLYMMPYNNTINNILKYDWKTEQVSYLTIPGLLTAGNNKVSGAVLAQDGCIYGTPSESTSLTGQIIKIDFGLGIKKGVYCREVNKY